MNFITDKLKAWRNTEHNFGYLKTYSQPSWKQEATMKPTLLILAAGMGSRYGGIKQIEPVGLNGETILEYSVFDALQAGFGRVVFVIRRDIQQDFDTHVLPRFSSKISCEYVFQELTDVPTGIPVSPNRKKPWGTAHAMLSARGTIAEPFAVINADDFYGQSAFKVMGNFLAQRNSKEKNYAMVGYQLLKTVSEHGTVSRGICQVDEKHELQGMVEHLKIEKVGNEIISHFADGGKETFSGNTSVSMNFFGFTPAIFSDTETRFREFLKTSGQEEKSEYLIPFVVNSVIKDESKMEVLSSDAQWFGITYKEDRPKVVASIQKLVKQGTYPAKLWE